MKEKFLLLYVDGSCYWKNRLGGCGIYIEFRDRLNLIHTKKEAFGFSNTTISRMELRAAIFAMKMIKDKSYKVSIISDSKYVIDSMNTNPTIWDSSGFSSVANPDLIEALINEKRKFTTIKCIHIKGHSKGDSRYIEGNKIADNLANYKNFTEYVEDIVGEYI